MCRVPIGTALRLNRGSRPRRNKSKLPGSTPGNPFLTTTLHPAPAAWSGRARRGAGRMLQGIDPAYVHRRGITQLARKSVGSGKSVSVRVVLGGRRIIKKKKK